MIADTAGHGPDRFHPIFHAREALLELERKHTLAFRLSLYALYTVTFVCAALAFLSTLQVAFDDASAGWISSLSRNSTTTFLMIAPLIVAADMIRVNERPLLFWLFTASAPILLIFDRLTPLSTPPIDLALILGFSAVLYIVLPWYHTARIAHANYRLTSQIRNELNEVHSISVVLRDYTSKLQVSTDAWLDRTDQLLAYSQIPARISNHNMKDSESSTRIESSKNIRPDSSGYIFDRLGNKDSYIDLKFCCDIGVINFRRYLDREFNNKGQGISFPRRSAFATKSVSPVLVELAISRFNARLLNDEDVKDWESVVGSANTLSESAHIALQQTVCSKHQLIGRSV